jgi:hypothetical protein
MLISLTINSRIPQKPVVMSDAPEGQVVPAPFVLKYFGVYDLSKISRKAKQQ